MNDLDDRLASAWADLEGQPVGTPDASAFVARRQRARNAVRGAALGAAVLVGVAGVAAVPLADRDDSAEVATFDADAQADLEASLLTTAELPGDWTAVDPEDASTSDTCGAEVVDGDGALGTAERQHFAMDVDGAYRVLAQVTYAYGSPEDAARAFGTLADVLDDCRSQTSGGTRLDLERADLATGAEETIAYRGTFVGTASVEEAPGEAWFVLVRQGDRVSLLADATFGGSATPQAEVAAIVSAAVSKLGA